nr:MAG TPA: hypothetical protein [Bacteriophage sp.]
MFIVQVSSKAFIGAFGGGLIITLDKEKATKYETIGDAMRAAALANDFLELKTIRVIRYNGNDLRAILEYAKDNNLMDKPFVEVYNLYKRQ